ERQRAGVPLLAHAVALEGALGGADPLEVADVWEHLAEDRGVGAGLARRQVERGCATHRQLDVLHAHVMKPTVVEELEAGAVGAALSPPQGTSATRSEKMRKQEWSREPSSLRIMRS